MQTLKAKDVELRAQVAVDHMKEELNICEDIQIISVAPNAFSVEGAKTRGVVFVRDQGARLLLDMYDGLNVYMEFKSGRDYRLVPVRN